jgi:hypothetical protein
MTQITESQDPAEWSRKPQGRPGQFKANCCKKECSGSRRETNIRLKREVIYDIGRRRQCEAENCMQRERLARMGREACRCSLTKQWPTLTLVGELCILARIFSTSLFSQSLFSQSLFSRSLGMPDSLILRIHPPSICAAHESWEVDV